MQFIFVGFCYIYGLFAFLPEICYIGARYAGVSFHRVSLYDLIPGFRNMGVRQTRNGLYGVSYTGDILLCQGARCTGISLYLYVVIHKGTLYLRISQQILPREVNRVFSLTWPAFMQIYWNKRKRLHKKRVQLPEDWSGTPTWPPFHCFGAPIWPP